DIPEHGAIALQRAGFVVSLVELDLAKADVTTLKIHRFHLPPAHCRPPADLPARFVPMVPSPSRFHPRPPVGQGSCSPSGQTGPEDQPAGDKDRKSTRLNSSHVKS